MIVAEAAPPRPGLDTYLKYARDFRHLPGIIGSGWRSGDPDSITVHARGEGWAKLARNVFGDAVHASRLVIRAMGDDGSGTPPANGSTPFWDDINFLMQAASALPGVIGYMPGYDMTSPDKYIVLMAASQQAREHADALVSDSMAGFRVTWQVGSAPFPSAAECAEITQRMNRSIA